MQYKSFIRLLHHLEVDHDVALLHNPQRLKKLLMAEFALSPTGFLTVDGVDFSKQEVLAELDSEDFSKRLSFHQAIWDHKILLRFLEEGITEEGLVESCLKLKDMEGFVHFVSPYFAPAFNGAMKACLAIPLFDAANTLLLLRPLIALPDYEAAFVSTRRFLEEYIRFFKNINEDAMALNGRQIKRWTGPWAKFLNNLPEELFGLKNKLSLVLIDLLNEIQLRKPRLTYLISKQLILLDFLGKGKEHSVKENHKHYALNAWNPSVRNGGKMTKKEQRIMTVILILSFIALVIVGRLESKKKREKETVIIENAQRVVMYRYAI